MRKQICFVLILTFSFQLIVAQTVPIKGVTFGLGIGYSRLQKQPASYFLSPDSNALRLQPLSRNSFVVSSVFSVKLSKLATQKQTEKGTAQTKNMIVVLNETVDPSTEGFSADEGSDTYKKAGFKDRLVLNIALNLADISSQNIAFNKSIDGGVGIGYVVNPNIQLVLFYDLIRIRQMRTFIVDAYENKRIPSGNDYFNALDENNNNLFYNKTFKGLSFKGVFAL